MASNLKTTELDFDDIKRNLKNFLKRQTVFNDYDFDAANELLSLWKEIVGTQQKAKDTAVKERKSQLKAASTGGTKGSAEKPSGKIYDARDLIDLHRRDPERYRLYADEITKAYAEGRVKR